MTAQDDRGATGEALADAVNALSGDTRKRLAKAYPASGTEPSQKVKYRYPTEAEAEAAWQEAHRSHRVTEDRGSVYCHTCGLTHWRGRKR